MTEIVNLGDIIVNYFNQEKTLQETAADLGALNLEIKRLKQRYRKYTKRMEELTQLGEIQERVIHRMLDRAIEKPDQPKKPHLTIVK